MSEFKYACPVCGQHLKCDSSQSGSVMECPTCFQKITVPQAPAEGDQKFILAGSKVSPKKYSLPVDEGGIISPEKKSSVASIIFVIAILLAGAGVFLFIKQHPRGKSWSHTPVAASAWQSGDIGAVGAVGSVSLAGGTFTINGSGADIWHTADGFYFVFQPLNGDGSLTAEVQNLQNTDEWAKGGVMIRESTNAGSVFALASLRADGQAQSIWRNATGAEAQASALVGGTGYPKWVKIVRSGNNFTMYFKVNAGDDWAQLGAPQTISMSPNVLIGLFVCAHNAGILSQAQFDQVALQAERNASPAAAPKAPKPAAPPANDTNWLLNLDGATNVPDAAAVGRIHGQNFLTSHAVWQGGTLTLRSADNLSLAISFAGALPEALAGRIINVTTNAGTAARVTLRWLDDGEHEKESFTNGYALRLELGPVANNLIPGKVYFCAPDDLKSYVMGTFTADIRKPKTKK